MTQGPVRLAARTSVLRPSATLAVTAEAARMKAEDIDVVGFGAGEPDFDTPRAICDKAIEAIHEGFTHYTATAGILPLRNAICRKFKNEQGLEYGPDAVIVTTGAKFALFLLTQVLLDPGDEAIIPAPYWNSYPEQVQLAGARPVIVETRESDGFVLRPDALDAAITDRTKLLILTSPSNPTGTVYGRAELAALAEVAIRRNILVVSDEIYDKVFFDPAGHVSIASISPGMKERTFVVGGFSKTYAMTGWRLGFAVGPVPGIKAAVDLGGHTTSNPNSIAQKAALAALLGGDESVRSMVAEFDRRRLYAYSRISMMPGITCVEPKGAFYLFPNVSQYYGRKIGDTSIKDSVSFSRALLAHGHVAIVPGAAFGSDSHVRISYATSHDEIEKGLDRFEEFLAKLS